MAKPADVHLVRVTTDARTHQLWVAAVPRGAAVAKVLEVVPEGWAAALLEGGLSSHELNALNLKPGEVRNVTAGSG